MTQRKTEYDRIYRILRKIRTQGMPTYRLLSYCGIPASAGAVTLQKLEQLGYIESIEEGRSIIWKCTMNGIQILEEMTTIFNRLECIN